MANTSENRVENSKKREELLGWKWLAGCWLSLVDWSGSGIAPLRAGLRSAAAPLRRSEVFGWKGRPVSERVGGMSMDTELQKHYALLLGIGSPWEVKTVELKLAEKKVEIELGWQWGQSAKCPECGRGLFDPRQRAGADVAAFGHDAVCHLDSGADAAVGLSGARSQDDASAVGGAAGALHAALRAVCGGGARWPAPASARRASCWASAGRRRTRSWAGRWSGAWNGGNWKR